MVGTDSETRHFPECFQLLDNFIESLIEIWVSRKAEPGPLYPILSGLTFAKIDFCMN